MTNHTYQIYSNLWFLLTHPVWDVTKWKLNTDSMIKISTHTSRVGCDALLTSWILLKRISTHTSRVGCDIQDLYFTYLTSISTHTSRVGCDGIKQILFEWHTISTHTSRVGCDWIPLEVYDQFMNFYSHIPCGMWPVRRTYRSEGKYFYSHIPCGMWHRL